MTINPRTMLVIGLIAGIVTVGLMLQAPDPQNLKEEAKLTTDMTLADQSLASIETDGDSKDPHSNDEPTAADSWQQPQNATSQHANRSKTFGDTVQFEVRRTCDAEGNCTVGPVALHEYANYSIEELKAIAEYDGAAAIILAHKLGAVDHDEAKEWALRAFLLTKDPHAFHMVTQFSGVHIGESIRADGTLDRVQAEQAYVWLKMGHLMGVGDAAYLGEQERILDSHGSDDRERLDQIAHARVDWMEEQRLDLTGRTF